MSSIEERFQFSLPKPPNSFYWLGMRVAETERLEYRELEQQISDGWISLFSLVLQSGEKQLTSLTSKRKISKKICDEPPSLALILLAA